MRLAIIDDYQSVWDRFVDWGQLKGVTVVPFRVQGGRTDRPPERL